MAEERPIHHGNHGLGQGEGEGPEPRAFSAREDDGLHSEVSMFSGRGS